MNEQRTDSQPLPVPQVGFTTVAFADLRREDGRKLIADVVGQAELARLVARHEPFAVAMVSNAGGFRSVLSVIDEAHLKGYLDQAVKIKMRGRTVLALEPELSSELMRYGAFLDSGPGGTA